MSNNNSNCRKIIVIKIVYNSKNRNYINSYNNDGNKIVIIVFNSIL